ncbi:MAG: hypothetical protein K8F31_01840 [Roseovarius sp.]|nr:hypothetical protein [Roseovarius sp.]
MSRENMTSQMGHRAANAKSLSSERETMRRAARRARMPRLQRAGRMPII